MDRGAGAGLAKDQTTLYGFAIEFNGQRGRMAEQGAQRGAAAFEKP